MPDRQTVEAFVALVEASRFIESMERFLHDDASHQENLDAPRQGLATLLAHERRVLQANRAARARHVGPILIDGDTVVIRWLFEFESVDGRRVTLDELAYQTWRGERIASERFYYDPRQLAR